MLSEPQNELRSRFLYGIEAEIRKILRRTRIIDSQVNFLVEVTMERPYSTDRNGHGSLKVCQQRQRIGMKNCTRLSTSWMKDLIMVAESLEILVTGLFLAICTKILVFPAGSGTPTVASAQSPTASACLCQTRS